MTRVALFGGSFNPPHVAHQMVALWALETQEIDELWFVPVYRHAFGKDLAPFEDRIEMCRLATKRFGEQVKVIDAEKDNASGRTYDLVNQLRTNSSHSFRLLVGTDILKEKDKWHRWDDLIAMAPPIIIGRSGHLSPGYETGFQAPDISSTQVRGLLERGERDQLASLLPASVLGYIDARNLYR